MAKQKKKAGVDLPYHELVRMIQQESKQELLWEKPLSVIVGLFSNLPNDEKDPRVLNQQSPELRCKADLAKQMKDGWQTNAGVDVRYNEIKKIFDDVESQLHLKLQFEDPKDFSRSKIREKISEAENALDPGSSALEDPKKGFNRMLTTLKILRLLVDFANDYRQEFGELLKAKAYTDFMELLADMLETKWGKNFHKRLENENITI